MHPTVQAHSLLTSVNKTFSASSTAEVVSVMVWKHWVLYSQQSSEGYIIVGVNRFLQVHLLAQSPFVTLGNRHGRWPKLHLEGANGTRQRLAMWSWETIWKESPIGTATHLHSISAFLAGCSLKTATSHIWPIYMRPFFWDKRQVLLTESLVRLGTW